MTIPHAFTLILLSIAGTAGQSFDARVARAKAVENSIIGKAYQKNLSQAVGADMATLMQECFPKQTLPDIRFFTVVANVLPTGILADVAVHPSTPMTQCFSTGFSRLPFPSSPASLGESGIPVVIEMRVTE